MAILGALILISAVGIGAVFWLLKNEKEGEEISSPFSELENQEPIEQAKADVKPDLKSIFLSKLALLKKKSPQESDASAGSKVFSNILKSVFEKFKFGKKDPQLDDVPEVTPLPSLKEYLEAEEKEKIEEAQEETAEKVAAESGTAAIKTVPTKEAAGLKMLSQEDEKNIEKEIELTAELNELKEKYGRLDALFNEKSAEYEKAKQSLNNELENRKEFNKVKDILEKELKDSKDKARSIQVELNNAQTEINGLKSRNDQLEEKITKLEKDILGKEDKISDLVKRMQAFASPSTAATPPVVEQREKTGNVGSNGSEGPDKPQSAIPSEETVQKKSSTVDIPLHSNSKETQPEKPEQDNRIEKEEGEGG